MQRYFLGILSLAIFWRISTCQRRITNSTMAGKGDETSFVAYIVNAEGPIHHGWMCVGSILSPNFLVTSAACMVEFNNSRLFAITGYRKYVPADNIDFDNCTRHMKRRIISYSAPLGFKTAYTKTRWIIHDIAVARVFPFFDFFDKRYLLFCSYLPTAINFSYDLKYESPGVDVVVYGWGHLTYYRTNDSNVDYNERMLHWSNAKIVSNEVCREKYSQISKEATNFTICTEGAGNLDGNGEVKNWIPPQYITCNGLTRRLGSNLSCDQDNVTSVPHDGAENASNETYFAVNMRRHGICQNDHGAPLVTWAGGNPLLLGVGSAFLVKQSMQCSGPYMYASVAQHFEFMYCLWSLAVGSPPTPWRRSGRENINCEGIMMQEGDV